MSTSATGDLVVPALTEQQYVSVDQHVTHTRPNVDRGYKWCYEDKLFLHVLFNEYDLHWSETLEIFHHVTGCRDKGYNYGLLHLSHKIKQRFADRNGKDFHMIDRPNPWNTTPYDDAEKNIFKQMRNTIEEWAEELGYNVVHQTGISVEGVQVNLMH